MGHRGVGRHRGRALVDRRAVLSDIDVEAEFGIVVVERRCRVGVIDQTSGRGGIVWEVPERWRGREGSVAGGAGRGDAIGGVSSEGRWMEGASGICRFRGGVGFSA